MNAVELLKEDHEQVARLFKKFEMADEDLKGEIATRICRLLTIHAQIEEQLLYPAARSALEEAGEDLVDEAVVEHASVKNLVGQIESSGSSDELFSAKVRVLGEYVRHHVKEEEAELFPQLEDSELDLESLGTELEARKAELVDATDEQSNQDQGGSTLTIAPESGGGGKESNRSPAR